MLGAARDDERALDRFVLKLCAESRKSVRRELPESFYPKRHRARAFLQTGIHGSNDGPVRARSGQRQEITAVLFALFRLYMPQRDAPEPAAPDERSSAFDVPREP